MTAIASKSAELLAAARAAADGSLLGVRLPVFPIPAGRKSPPAINRWEERASADLEVIERAWSGRWAGSNLECPPGRVGLVVLDLDAHGELPADWRPLPGVHDGADVFACLLEWAGEPRWPVTTWVRTPSGGYHLWFTQTDEGPPVRNSAGLLGPGVDVRGVGGYVLLPGSQVGGREYELLDDCPPTPLPAWLVRRLRPQPAPQDNAGRGPARGGPANLRGLVETVQNGRPGDRTGRLVWAAHRLRDEIAAGRARLEDAELLVQAAVEAGIRGGDLYARYQVRHVLGGDW